MNIKDIKDIQKDAKVIIMIDQMPHLVIDVQLFNPSKGKPFGKVTSRNLISGVMTGQRSYKVDEVIELAITRDVRSVHLYDGDGVSMFVNKENAEEFSMPTYRISDDPTSQVSEDASSDKIVTFWENEPILVSPAR